MFFMGNCDIAIMEVVNMCCTNIAYNDLMNILCDDLMVSGSAAPEF